jgi:phenylalanyl-tRNA synthetase beta chain
MKVSYRWLERHVDLSGIPAQELARDLTIHTAEVEGLQPFAPWLSAVVVGEVRERARHPDADKLSLCRVDVGARGDGALLEIVCGAPNVAAGQRVAVALPGCELPGELRIKKSKIRGVESQGMICSQRELALSDEHEGIWVLPGSPPVGQPVAAALGLEDWVLEIDNKSLTHRPDLWGHRGIAREVAAIRGRALKPLALELPRTTGGTPYPVRVESAGCSRYLGLVIEGVHNGPAPEWMRWLLLAVGQRPLDLFVDLSNFVMLELGQPNHLFDLARLAPEGILVRDARAGERTRTLDGVERALTPEDVLITSGGEIVALAGVMGGEASKVTPGTSSLLLEAASFHPTRVRRTAARLGLRSEASARFEKNLSPTLPPQAAAHLVNLLRSLQPGLSLPRPPGDAGDWQDPARRVPLRPARVRALLGAEVADREIESILGRLELPVERGEPWTVSVPSQRATKDLRREEDLIEEVGRMHGYLKIAERALSGPLVPAPFDERRALVRRLSDRLAGDARFHESLTHSFLAAADAQLLGIADEPHVRLVNPLIEGLDRVRRSLVPSLLAHLAHNRRQRDEVRLFEVGKGYLPEHANERGEPRELHELALLWAAPRSTRFDGTVLARLQGVLEDLLRCAGRPGSGWTVSAETPPRWAHPARCLVLGPGPLVWLAALEPEVQARLGLAGELDCEVACAALSIDRLLELPEQVARFRPLPRFPGIKVDVALALPEACPAGEARAAIEKAGKGLVRGCELFDLYRGPNLGPGRKSLAYHVLLQAEERTLSDQDAARFLARLERELAPLEGELRRA